MNALLMPGKFTIFSKEGCIYCDKVIRLMQQHHLCYNVIKCEKDNITNIVQNVELFISPKKHNTFPIVFDGLTFVGGYNDTHSYLQTLLDFTDTF